MLENNHVVLGKAFALICFPATTLEASAANPMQKGILADREVGSLLLHLVVHPGPRVNFIHQHGSCPHRKVWAEPLGVLSINKSIFVVGFGLCGSVHGAADYPVNIQVVHMDSTMDQNDLGFSCDGSTSTFWIMFKKPVGCCSSSSTQWVPYGRAMPLMRHQRPVQDDP